MKKNNDDQGLLECQVFKHYRYYKTMLSAQKLVF